MARHGIGRLYYSQRFCPYAGHELIGSGVFGISTIYPYRGIGHLASTEHLLVRQHVKTKDLKVYVPKGRLNQVIEHYHAHTAYAMGRGTMV